MQFCLITVGDYHKSSFVKSLLVNYNVAFLQEHWLADGQLHCIGDIDDNFVYTGLSGFDCIVIYWLDGRTEGMQFCGAPIYMLMLKLLIPTAVEYMQFVLLVIVSNYCHS